MQPVDIYIIEKFASAFCEGRKGLSMSEIPQFFSQYQGGVPTSKSYQMAVAKSVVFQDCVQALSPLNQWHALFDLCENPPKTKHALPTEDERKELLSILMQADGSSPLAIEFSKVSLNGVRDQWMIAASRVINSPSSAITAARTLLETTCKTILNELNETPDDSGNLLRLYNQTRRSLGLEVQEGASQSIHKFLNGFTQIIEALASISNIGGDRHGLVNGEKISDISFAGLAVHASGTISLFLTRIYKEHIRTN